MALFLYFVLALVAVFVYFKYIRSESEDTYVTLAPYYGDKCWTKAEEVVDTEIKPFTIKIPDTELEDLKNRLASTRFPTSALKESKFTYGVNSEFMRDFVEYWKKTYNWRMHERELNKFPHFKTKIEGLDIHFVHVKPETTSALNRSRPLMLIHGWPGSFYEFYKVIPMLTHPTSHGGNETDLFEVIVPSIPGYGFSQASELMGLGTLHCARIFHKLMLRLGHKNYYLQGGDWGSVIANNLSILYPSAVKGLHFNFYGGGTPPLTFMKVLTGSLAPRWLFHEKDVEKMFPLKKRFMKLLQETGYMHLQATKPDTVGFALTDSPVGLAAYILEKFSSWSNMESRNKDDGGIPEYWTYDELLNNIMVYWWSRNITSSMRFYKESVADAFATRGMKVRPPAGFAWFPHEFDGVLREQVAARCTNLTTFTRMKEGGHFAAFQVPNLLVEDFRNFVRKVEQERSEQARDESGYAKEFKQTHLDRFEQ